jgi:AraC-like DNA-binding protein
MTIQTIDVRQHSASGGTFTENGLYHQKSLPLLSVVQAIEGSYGIGIDTKVQQSTGAMGAFIAPSRKMQYITHFINAKTGIMRAQWIFIDIIINQQYRIDDLYDFPTLLPKNYQSSIHDIIQNCNKEKDLCANLSEIYKLIGILLELGTEKEQMCQLAHEIIFYINQHYMEKLTDDRLAKEFAVSVPTLYRKFKAYFQRTPANYINDTRLSKSIVLLETTSMSVSAICEAVGIIDIFYYSKLFKLKYGESPSSYRKRYQSGFVIKP